jgi:nicotinamide-nucleotide amidase
LKVGILTIGNELTSGKTRDTNSSFIAGCVNGQGWQVSAMMSVGDDKKAIKRSLEYMMAVSDALIITGGLGPTADDITTAAVAEAFGLTLYMDEAALEHIQTLFRNYGLKWTENNAKQATFPEGAHPISNPVGTAWSFSLKIGGKIIVVVPGVPVEVTKIIPEQVVPLFEREFNEKKQHVERRTIKLFGIAEAVVDQALADINCNQLDVNVGFYPHFPEIHVALTTRQTTREGARRRIQIVENEVIKRLREYVFAYDDETLEGVVATLLTKKRLTLSVAESCTGGLITDRLTDVSGSSAFLERGVIAYSNLSKMDLLGISDEVLKEFGAVSEQTAVLMAKGARERAKTDIGLATTGIAGPTGGTESKPVGAVFVAMADDQETFCRHFIFRWNRRRIKIITSQVALMMLKRYLSGERLHE